MHEPHGHLQPLRLRADVSVQDYRDIRPFLLNEAFKGGDADSDRRCIVSTVNHLDERLRPFLQKLHDNVLDSCGFCNFP